MFDDTGNCHCELGIRTTDQGIEDTDMERHNEAAVDAILRLALEQVSTDPCLMCSDGLLGEAIDMNVYVYV